ncbi:MAG: hypothetical protein IPK60_19825 [Sandaracinaceae bacterium]|nr:hypothetical protein [Sandaracinaceae bacterium]
MLSRIVRAIVFAATLWASAGLTWWTAPSFAQELPLTPRELPVDVEDGPDLVLPAPPPGFVTERRGQVEWVYPARAREEALGLMRAYDKEWPRIVEELGGDVDARLVVRIGKDPQEMERLAPLNAPPPAYASGVAYPASGWILLTLSAPETWELPNLRLVFAHELSHIALHRAVNGVPLPRWFVEGVAINQSGERSFERVRTLWEANVSGNLVTMRALSRSFPSRAHEVNIAYAQSASFVAFMHDDTDHADRVPRLIRELRRGRAFPTAIFEAYNRTLGTLEREWRKELNERYTALPLIMSGSGLWVLTSVLIVLAAMRARRRKRATLQRWGEEEADRDRVERGERDRIAALRARQAAMLEVTPLVLTSAPAALQAPSPPPPSQRDYLVPMPLGEAREADVPTITHDGSDHTLH